MRTRLRNSRAASRAGLIRWPGVRSTTSTFLVVWSSAFFMSTCRPMLRPHRTGTMTMLNTNALVRTAAWYSRPAITQTLRMALLRGVGAGNANEDLLERRPGQLEVPDLAAGHEGRQHLLRVGVGREPQLLEPAEVGDLGHARQPVEADPLALDPHPQRVAAVGVLNRLQGAVEH